MNILLLLLFIFLPGDGIEILYKYVRLNSILPTFALFSLFLKYKNITLSKREGVIYLLFIIYLTLYLLSTILGTQSARSINYALAHHFVIIVFFVSLNLYLSRNKISLTKIYNSLYVALYVIVIFVCIEFLCFSFTNYNIQNIISEYRFNSLNINAFEPFPIFNLEGFKRSYYLSDEPTILAMFFGSFLPLLYRFHVDRRINKLFYIFSFIAVLSTFSSAFYVSSIITIFITLILYFLNNKPRISTIFLKRTFSLFLLTVIFILINYESYFISKIINIFHGERITTTIQALSSLSTPKELFFGVSPGYFSDNNIVVLSFWIMLFVEAGTLPFFVLNFVFLFIIILLLKTNHTDKYMYIYSLIFSYIFLYSNAVFFSGYLFVLFALSLNFVNFSRSMK